jgi:hypothetical protein
MVGVGGVAGPEEAVLAGPGVLAAMAVAAAAAASFLRISMLARPRG